MQRMKKGVRGEKVSFTYIFTLKRYTWAVCSPRISSYGIPFYSDPGQSRYRNKINLRMIPPVDFIINSSRFFAILL
jgi:hypothetical protein